MNCNTKATVMAPKTCINGSERHISVRERFFCPPLLRRILALVRESSTRSQFLPCLHVCRSFYHVAFPILYSAVCLTDSSLAKFLKYSDPLIGSNIETLTIRLLAKKSTPQQPSGFPSNVEQLLGQLAETIRRDIRCIGSFSFRIEDMMLQGYFQHLDKFSFTPSISAFPLIDILDALPSTCWNLEIDTSGFEVYHHSEHICPYIARLVPTLRHLRIRTGQLCHHFMPVPLEDICDNRPDEDRPSVSPTLCSLVINTEVASSKRTLGTLDCSTNFLSDFERVCVAGRLARFLHIGYTDRNYFPKIQQLEVHSWIKFPSLAPGIRQVDALKGQTYLHGFLPLPTPQLHSPRPMSWRVIRTVSGRDIIAPFGQAREILEESWISATDGTRLPKCYLRSHEERDLNLPFEAQYKPPSYGKLATYLIEQMDLRRPDDFQRAYLEELNYGALGSAVHKTLGLISNEVDHS